MENNQNSDNQNSNFGSGHSPMDLMKVSIPDWLQELFSYHSICACPDINEGIIEGYPTDDDF